MLKKLANIPHDKLLHFYYGSLVALVSTLVVGALWSIPIVLTVAVGKEVYHHFYGGTVEFYDIVWTVHGGAIVWVANIGGLV